MPQPESNEISAQRDALARRVLDALNGTFDIFAIHIGHRLGLYDALAASGPQTSSELAAGTGTVERYVREWLEQQTVSGIVEVDDAAIEAKSRRFALPAGHAEVLVERESLNYMAPIAQLAVGATRPLAALLQAFRSGAGVPYADYGKDVVEGQAAINRAAFLQLIGSEWLPSMADVHTRLLSEPAARVADFGCGAGWSSIAIARAYPAVRVDGLDLDPASVELARRNVAEAGLEDRVRIEARDAGDPELSGRYNLVTAFECIHDMSQPVQALRAMKGLLGEGGALLVVDERVGDAFSAEADEVERIMYGWSLLHCLAVGMAEQPSAETGTVMRTETLRGYATSAGFGSIRVLPVENLFFRLYRLDP